MSPRPANFDPNGKGHFVLARLAAWGETGRAALMAAAMDRYAPKQAAKVAYAIAACQRHALAVHRPGYGYSLTAAGRDVLAELEAGRAWTPAHAPNARVFARPDLEPAHG